MTQLTANLIIKSLNNETYAELYNEDSIVTVWESHHGNKIVFQKNGKIITVYKRRINAEKYLQKLFDQNYKLVEENIVFDEIRVLRLEIALKIVNDFNKKAFGVMQNGDDELIVYNFPQDNDTRAYFFELNGVSVFDTNILYSCAEQISNYLCQGFVVVQKANK